MGKLPELTPEQVVRAFERAGFVVRRRGNHIILTKAGHLANLAVPNHRSVARGTLRSLIRDAGLSDAEFLGLL